MKNKIVFAFAFLLWFIAALFLDFYTLKFLVADAAESDYRQPVHEKIDKVDLVNVKRFDVWRKQCVKCHGPQGLATEHGTTLDAPENLFISVGSKSIEEITDIVTNGKNKMPAFKETLDKEEIELISRYVRIRRLLWKLEKESKLIESLENIINNSLILQKELRKERKGIDTKK